MCQTKHLVRMYYHRQHPIIPNQTQRQATYFGGGGEGPRLALGGITLCFCSFSFSFSLSWNSICERLKFFSPGPLSLDDRRCWRFSTPPPKLNWIDFLRGASSAYEMRLLGLDVSLSLRSESDSNDPLGDETLDMVEWNGNVVRPLDRCNQFCSDECDSIKDEMSYDNRNLISYAAVNARDPGMMRSARRRSHGLRQTSSSTDVNTVKQLKEQDRAGIRQIVMNEMRRQTVERDMMQEGRWG